MNKRIHILLVCAGGNSTSILVNDMQKKLKEEECWEIEASSYEYLPKIIGKFDYILVAPQVKYRKSIVEELAHQIGDIKVLEIPTNVFASCDGSLLLNMIRKVENPNSSPEEREIHMSEKSKSAGLIEKISEWMMEYIAPVANKIGNQRYLAAVRDGLTIIIPATIVGGFAILLAVPPVPSSITEPTNFFFAFLLGWQSWAATYSELLLTPYNFTIGIISLYAVCGVSYRLAERYKMNALNNMVSAMLVFFVISGALDIANGTISIARLGAAYMFAAMITGLLVVEINHQFDVHNIKIKLPASVPPNVAGPFNVLIALVFNVVLFSLVNTTLITFTGGGIPDLIYTIFVPLMHASGSLPSILFLSFLTSLFWFFGIHGDNMMSAIITPITTTALAANAEAVAAGQPMPYIYAGAMAAVYGGWLVLNNAMNLDLLLFSKSSQIRSLSKVAAVPAFFNIGEPYVFGLPTVLNVYYFIPSVICQIMNITAYYLLASINVVGRFYITMPFTTPAPLQAFLGTGGNIPALFLAVGLLGVNMIIFFPFMKAYDRSLMKEEELEALREQEAASSELETA
ncbi:PTS system, lactose/cellobiose family IIC component [Firmicutes bacterium M10-2]|nr:PTS system, lactose/cellobiose family IIC component [Firmicutes bacterium M10-2]